MSTQDPQRPTGATSLPDLSALPLMGATPAPATPAPTGNGHGAPQAHRLAGALPSPDLEPDLAGTTITDDEQLDPTPEELDQVDWSLVRALRGAIAERIVESGQADDTRQGLDRERDTPLARRVLREEISTLQHARVNAGEESLTRRQVVALTSATLDAVFGVGRLQRFLDDPSLEDIVVRGCDNVWLVYGDGQKIQGPPAADTDDELIEDLRQLGAHAPGGERPFNEGQPRLNMSLGEQGHRLSASMGFTHRPTATIRRQGYRDITLRQMVDDLNALDDTAAQLLTTSIKAGKNVVVSGLPSAGKTTMIRALLNTLDPSVAIATIETEYELALHHMRERHPMVWAAQYRPGGEDGAGEVTLFDLMVEALRQSVDRIVVGEVRGPEILVMFDAMQAGKGAVTTIHATSAENTVDRIVNCAIKMPQTSIDWAYRETAAHVDLIVNLGVHDETPIGGRKLRFVREITSVTPNPDNPRGIAFTHLMAPGADGRAVPTGNIPDWIADIELYGFDRSLLLDRVSGWNAPLDTLANRALTEGDAS